MKQHVRQTRSHLMEKFEEHGFHPNTKLGQNFLIDINLVEYIVAQAELEPDDLVLEIGAGTGGMTTFLAAQAGHVIAVELDARMHQLAEEAISPWDNVTLLRQDALRNKNHFAKNLLEEIQSRFDQGEVRRLKLVSNLPYSVATPVVTNLVATDLPWSRMVITIQWELGQRMVAEPSTADYGALSVWLTSQCDVRVLRKLPPLVFWPRPKVDSAIVRLEPNEARRDAIADRPFLQDFLRRLFHHRRKLLRRVLVGMYRKQMEKPAIDALLEDIGLAGEIRAEELPPDQLVTLANRMFHSLDAESGRSCRAGRA